MYIHGYQIHNVLDVYRRQLSQPKGAGKTSNSSTAAARDQINISMDGQRQSIFDKITSDIVDRITQFDQPAELDAGINENLSLHAAGKGDEKTPDETEFTYNVIDEHNRKVSNTLPLHRLNPWAQYPESNLETVGAEGQQNEKE